ncbi:MAG: TIGR04283 family arsenosugar biosynthesis glycosyltransferase [Planctomycetota bacterium]|nr:TIGR04283 family arsenosugar biosynthesis glycosyltransferase [Planctomycetota bacterium]
MPALGPQRAAELQREMTRHTLSHARALAQRRDVEVQVRFAGGDAHAMRSLYGPGFTFTPQGEGDLGQRLSRAADGEFATGAGSVVMIGTDCPQLSAQVLEEAFALLGRHDLVVGPASDGGYYLVGLRHRWPDLFAGIDWGTERVLEQTLSIARRMSLLVARLQTLSDVDRPEDLHLWSNRSPERPRSGARLSVIIPALNEETLIASAILSASAPGVELVVVDGGSTDRTAAIAASLGCEVLNGPAGRARQMNVGAASTSGDVLLFLHADSTLPKDFAERVAHTLSLPKTAAGAFTLAIAPAGRMNRVLAETTNLRSRCLGMPYGDQAIFVSRAVFERIRGYADIPIMEDVDLVERLKRVGRVRLVPEFVTTSGRRWQQHGRIRTSALNQLLLIGYYLGIGPKRLHRWREGAGTAKANGQRERRPEPKR